MAKAIEELVEHNPELKEFFASPSEDKRMELVGKLQERYSIALPGSDLLTSITPIEVASALGDLSALELIAKQYPQSVSSRALELAANGGHVDVVDRLLKDPAAEKDSFFTSGALEEAAAGGSLVVIERLLKEPAVRKFMTSFNNVLEKAALGGHLDALERLLKESVLEKKVTNGNSVLRAAARGGNPDVVARLLKYPDICKCIVDSGNSVMRVAASGGHLDVVDLLLSYPDVLANVAAVNNCALLGAVEGGHIDVVNRLLKIPAVEKAFSVSGGGSALIMAAMGGHLDVVKRLLEFPAVVASVAADKNSALREAAGGGHTAIVDLLLKYPAVQAAFASVENNALLRAAGGGHLNVVNLLLEYPAFEKSLCDHNCAWRALRWAAAGGHLGVVRRLLELPVVQNEVAANDNGVLRSAIEGGHQVVVDVLLQYPSVFSYAERHVHEYGQFVTPFMIGQLDALREKKHLLEENNPNAVFDIANPIEAQLYFYFIRYFIANPSTQSRDNIIFLLDIPAVKALAPMAVTPGNPNELVRLAITTGNHEAEAILLRIPLVSQIAEENQFYRNEASGQLNLGVMAQDRESSMVGLSTGEQKRLAKAFAHYEPIIKSKRNGVEGIFIELLKQLESNYKKDPATIKRENGKIIKLPLDWDTFQNLALTQTERSDALIAYYKNHNHSALRWMSKPNPWMASDAHYVEVDPQNRNNRWSSYEEYKPLIAMLWLAAKDENIAVTDGYTLEGREEQFISEIAYIGRAHNWDVTRSKKGKPGEIEEYDDEKGDKPSCFSGVKRRLFQSVCGHPLLDVLTFDMVLYKFREFTRQYFLSVLLKDENGPDLKAAWKMCIENPDPANPATAIALEKLKKLNMSREKLDEFTDSLANQYKEVFDVDLRFKLRKELKQNNNAPGEIYHAIKWGGFTQLGQLLEQFKSAESAVNNTEDDEAVQLRKRKFSTVNIYERFHAELVRQHLGNVSAGIAVLVNMKDENAKIGKESFEMKSLLSVAAYVAYVNDAIQMDEHVSLEDKGKIDAKAKLIDKIVQAGKSAGMSMENLRMISEEGKEIAATVRALSDNKRFKSGPGDS